MVKLKEFVSSRWFFLMLLGMLTVGFGLSDMDYYWQVYAGKNILTDFNFNSLSNLLVYPQNAKTYLDHEWLTNIIFYLFSLLDY